MSKDEIIDQVDAENNIIGPIAKETAHAEGLWHRAAHIWIYSSDGYVLVQLRAGGSSGHIGLLDVSAAGHIQAGRSPEEGAHDELLEELNINLDPTDLKLAKIHKQENPWPQRGTTHREFYYIYFVQLPRDTRFEFTDGEVSNVMWMPIKKFAGILDDAELRQSFVPHSEQYLGYVVTKLTSTVGDTSTPM